MATNYPPYPTKLVAGGAQGGAGGEASTPPSGERYYPPTPQRITAGGGAEAATAPGGAPGFNRLQFVEKYANMVARTWTDPTYLETLLADPVRTLVAAGLQATEGAVIRFIQCKVTGQGSIDEQVEKWLEGLRTGRYDIYLPIMPDDVEIPSDAAVGGDDINCCCTPCCCCT